jgi:O-antigen/teichoic acid export membrane protein
MTSTLVARAILGAISVAIIFAIALFSQKPVEVKTLLILLGMVMFVTNLFGSFSAVLMGLERFTSYGLFSALYSFGVAALGITALHLGFGLVGIGTSQLIVGLIVAIMGILYVSRGVLSPCGGIDLRRSLAIVKKASPLGVTGLLTMVYYRADFIILSYTMGDTVVGYYNAASTVVNSLLLFAATFSNSLLPRLSSLFADNFEVLGRIYRVAFKYLLFVGIGVAFGATALAGPIIEFLFGTEYLSGATALSILIWASALMFVNSLQGTLLVASDMKRHLVYLTGAAAAVNLALNFALIPPLGIRGAAIAKVASELVAGAWAFVLNRKHNAAGDLATNLTKAVAAGAVMAAALVLFPQAHVLIRVLIGALVYTVCLVILRGLDAHDFRIVGIVLGWRQNPAERPPEAQ